MSGLEAGARPGWAWVSAALSLVRGGWGDDVPPPPSGRRVWMVG